jgi:uncharacterized iron-regulated membrane protein
MIVRPAVGCKRLNFDLHSVVGFWTFLILFMWAVTGGYFVYPEPFRAVINVFTPIDPPRVAATPAGLVRADTAQAPTSTANTPSGAANGAPSAAARRPARRRRPLTTGGKILRGFSFAHYGNFAGWKIKTLWMLLGFAPVLLFGTALVMWWNRVLAPMWRRREREWDESSSVTELAPAIQMERDEA